MSAQPDLPSGIVLLESVNRLRDAETLMRHRARTRVGMKPNEFQAIQHIAVRQAAGLPTRSRQIADALGVTGAAVSMLVDRLVERGLVRRSPDPDDQRARVLVVTDQAQQALSAAYGDLPVAVQKLLDAVSAEDANRMAALASAVQEVVDGTAQP